jgi:hypothetical protein
MQINYFLYIVPQNQKKKCVIKIMTIYILELISLDYWSTLVSSEL